MSYDTQRAHELLRQGSGHANATFRDGQEEAIRHIVEGKGRLLVVQKTGWGKSFVYFIATRLLREQGHGPALLISPLLSLMRNQIDAAQRMGVRAETINSANLEQWNRIEQAIARNEVDILLISPERLANEHFRDTVLGPIARQTSLLVIDEAHCISDWGHDFRPHYRFIEQIVRLLPDHLRLLATTATANNRVVDDLQDVLGPNLTVSRGPLGRPSLLLQTMTVPGQAERLAWLATHLPKLPGSGIVYTLTIRDAEQVASFLQSRGIEAEAYSGQTGDGRAELEQALLENKVKALVATTALGMGYDKPDLAFVIHYQTPGSVVGYYQQVGRGGRQLDAAYGILLSGEEEDKINDFFIESAFPSKKEVEAVFGALRDAPAGLSVNELMTQANIRKGRIEKALQMLSLEMPAPITKKDTRWALTAVDLSEEFWKRAERLTALRREEQQQMRDYVQLKDGHMEFLIRALDGDATDVRVPDIPPLAEAYDSAEVEEAIGFLKRTSLEIEPRRQWPNGGLPNLGVRGNIKEESRHRPGRILSVWGDAGWGQLVRVGRKEKHLSDKLVEACAAMYRNWNPQPSPSWLSCIPARVNPDPVTDFAQRLADALGLPFREVLRPVGDRAAQWRMENSFQQARNIDGAFAIEGKVPRGPVLLIDDRVDSRWTLTVVSHQLLAAGCGSIHPLVLASMGR